MIYRIVQRIDWKYNRCNKELSLLLGNKLNVYFLNGGILGIGLLNSFLPKENFGLFILAFLTGWVVYSKFYSFFSLQICEFLLNPKRLFSGIGWSERQGEFLGLESLRCFLANVNSAILFPLMLFPIMQVDLTFGVLLKLALVLTCTLVIGLLYCFSSYRSLNLINLNTFFVINLGITFLYYRLANIPFFTITIILLLIFAFYQPIKKIFTVAMIIGVSWLISHYANTSYLFYSHSLFLFSILFIPVVLPNFTFFLSVFYDQNDFYKWITKADFTPADKSILLKKSDQVKLFKKLIGKDLRNAFRLDNNVAQIQLNESVKDFRMGVALDFHEIKYHNNDKIEIKGNNEVISLRPLSSLNEGWNELNFSLKNETSEFSIELSTSPKGIYFQSPISLQGPKSVKNFIVIIMDALAKDSMSIYNKNGVQMPNTEAFFKDAAIYNDAYIQGEWTTACFTHMFSSMYSSHHNMNNRYDGLKPMFPSKYKTLAETFQSNGYNTFFYSGSRRVSQRCGYDRGFNRVICDEYQNMINSDVTYKAIEELEANKNIGNLLVLHYMDTHGPPLFWSTQKRDINSNFRNLPVKTTTRSSPEQWEEIYKNQVSECDLSMSILFNFLNRPEYADNTAVIFTADHGQPINMTKEKNEDTISSLEPLFTKRMLNVPLLLKCPWHKDIKTGIIDGIVEAGIDLYPTLLQLAGIKDSCSPYSRSYLNNKNELFYGKEYSITESIYNGKVQRIIISKSHIYYSSFKWTESASTNSDVEILWEIGSSDFKRLNVIKDENTLNTFRTLVVERQLVTRKNDSLVYYGTLVS